MVVLGKLVKTTLLRQIASQPAATHLIWSEYFVFSCTESAIYRAGGSLELLFGPMRIYYGRDNRCGFRLELLVFFNTKNDNINIPNLMSCDTYALLMPDKVRHRKLHCNFIGTSYPIILLKACLKGENQNTVKLLIFNAVAL